MTRKKLADFLTDLETTGISNEVLANAREYIDYNEFGVAFELVITELHEQSIPLSKNQFEQARNIGLQLQLPEPDFLFLAELVKS